MMNDLVSDFKRVLRVLGYSSSPRVPYTHHHDYLRENSNLFKGKSRSEVAERDASEVELYACCLAQVVNYLGAEQLLTLDEVDSFTTLTAIKQAKTFCDKIDQGY